MKCTYSPLPNAREYYSYFKKKKDPGRVLEWENGQKHRVLIVRTPYGVSPVGNIDKLLALLRKCDGFREGFFPLSDEFSVRLCRSGEKSCPMNGPCSTYTLFSCLWEDGELRLFELYREDETGHPTSLNISLDMKVSIAREGASGGLFRRHGAAEHYKLVFPQEAADEYRDGSLVCAVGGLEIPVTSAMLRQGTVYVRSDAAPELISKTNGLTVTTE